MSHLNLDAIDGSGVLDGLAGVLVAFGEDGVSDEVYDRAAAAFTDRELGQVIAMAVTINAWNRINAAVRMPPPRR